MGNLHTLAGRTLIAHKENKSFRKSKIWVRLVLVIMIIIGPRIHNSFLCKTRLLWFPSAFHRYMDARRRRIEAPESLCSSRTRDAGNPGIRANRSSIWAGRSSTRANPPSVWGGDPNTRVSPPSVSADPNIRVGW